jgi:hypothetical protein
MSYYEVLREFSGALLLEDMQAVWGALESKDWTDYEWSVICEAMDNIKESLKIEGDL